MDNFDIIKWVENKLKKQNNNKNILDENLDKILRFIENRDKYCDDDRERIKNKILEIDRFFKIMNKENNEDVRKLYEMFDEIGNDIRDINNSIILENVSNIDKSVNEFKNEISCNNKYDDKKIIKEEKLCDRFEYKHKGLIKINKLGNMLEIVPLCLLFEEHCYYIDINLLKLYIMEMEENKNMESIKMIDVYKLSGKSNNKKIKIGL